MEEGRIAVLTGGEYRANLKVFSPEVYMRGERADKVYEHPLLRQTLNHVAAGYDLAADPANRVAFSVPSPLVDEDVSRIGHHIRTSLEDTTVKARLFVKRKGADRQKDRRYRLMRRQPHGQPKGLEPPNEKPISVSGRAGGTANAAKAETGQAGFSK